MGTPQSPPSGRPGRYQRSAVGLITSLVVTVAAIAGLLYFMGAFRPDFEVKPQAVDYLETVQSAQQAGLTPVYPETLPEGWIATGVDVTPGDDPVFMVRMLTDDGRFAAVRQQDASASAMLAHWVDEDTESRAGYTVPDDVRRPVVREWSGFGDAGGDSAYVAELGDETLLVFGSASPEDLQAIIDVLVTAPLS